MCCICHRRKIWFGQRLSIVYPFYTQRDKRCLWHGRTQSSQKCCACASVAIFLFTFHPFLRFCCSPAKLFAGSMLSSLLPAPSREASCSFFVAKGSPFFLFFLHPLALPCTHPKLQELQRRPARETSVQQGHPTLGLLRPGARGLQAGAGASGMHAYCALERDRSIGGVATCRPDGRLLLLLW